MDKNDIGSIGADEASTDDVGLADAGDMQLLGIVDWSPPLSVSVAV